MKKLILAVCLSAMATQVNAVELRKNAIICDTPWQMEKILTVAGSPGGVSLEQIVKNVGCQKNVAAIEVEPTMQWPMKEMIVKVMVDDPRYPEKAGIEVWTDIIFLGHIQ